MKKFLSIFLILFVFLINEVCAQPIGRGPIRSVGIATSITDGIIVGADFLVTNAPTDNYVLSYDAATLGFTWIVVAAGHDAITLDVNADAILELAIQEIGLDTQDANTVFAGPVAGVAAVPTMRLLVPDDIPDISAVYLPLAGGSMDAGSHTIFPLHNDAVTPTQAFGDGDTGFYQGFDNEINITLAGTHRFYFNPNVFSAVPNDGGQLQRTGTTSTVPFVNVSGDVDTGIGRAAADQLSLIAGGVEGIRITENTAIYTTNFGGQIAHRTAVGAADYNPSILTSDYIIAMTDTAAARAVTISTEDEDTGSVNNPRIMIVKDESGGVAAQNITITLESGGTIDGAANKVMNQGYQSITLYIDGTNAFIY